MKDKPVDAGQRTADPSKYGGKLTPEDETKSPERTPEKANAGFVNPRADSKPAADAIKERMDVIASCGTKVGVVDHVEGEAIKLTKKDSSDGQHHFIPKDWVDRVDERGVYLKKNSMETERGWKSDAASCGCGA
jgi:hypothetical protein